MGLVSMTRQEADHGMHPGLVSRTSAKMPGEQGDNGVGG